MCRKNAIATVLVLLAVLASAVPKLHYIRNDSGGTLIWNNEEAYLFMTTAQRGLRVRYVSYPLVLLKELFYAVTVPDDERVIVTVVHITASSTERHVINIADPSPGSAPSLYTPLRGHIYADCPELGGLCRWNLDHFERATDEEQRELDGINNLTVPDFASVGGWSRRTTGTGPGQQFTAGVGSSFSILVKNEAKDIRGYDRTSVQVLRFGKISETVWHLEGALQGVTGSAYRATFNTH